MGFSRWEGQNAAGIAINCPLMFRFLLLGFPLAVLTLALSELLLRELAEQAPAAGSLFWAWRRLLLEGAALLVLFLWLDVRVRSWLLQGLTVGLIAWMFRGPLVALWLAERGQGGGPVTGFELSLALVQDLLAASVLAFLARSLERAA
jgi:hypothetical protein